MNATMAGARHRSLRSEAFIRRENVLKNTRSAFDITRFFSNKKRTESIALAPVFLFHYAL